MPRRIAVAIVRRMELHLATTNRKFRYTRPIADLKRSSETAWAEGVDVVFWGHFHTPWRCGNESHEGLIIPAWLENRTSVLVDGDGEWTLVDDRLQSVALEIDDLSDDEKRILAVAGR